MAMVPTVVDPSTRRLSEVARHVVAPAGIVDSLWFEVEAKCAEWGDHFDRWQDGLGQLALGIRADGYFACTVGGVTLSIPRQVVKTFIVSRIVFSVCALFPNTTVLWTAHRTRTSTLTFEKLKGLTRNPVVKAMLARNRSDGIRSANGEQEIRFKNESVVMFGARERGFGRGFDEVDIEVFDEAQTLTEKALDDMVAATNQSRFPHGALLFYMGTPPKPTDPGEVFTNRRRKALAVKADDVVYAEHGDTLYVECSADPNVGRKGGPSLDDIAQVAIANPSYPHRTPPVSIARLRANLASDDSWRREGLGVWDDELNSGRALSYVKWSQLGAAESLVGVPGLCFGVAFTVDRTAAAVGVAVERDGHMDVAVVRHESGVGWVLDECIKLDGAQPGVVFAVDKGGPAKTLIQPLNDEGLNVLEVDLDGYRSACALMVDGVASGSLRHRGQPQLDRAVRDAVWRSAGDGAPVFGRVKSAADITSLEAAALALFAAGESSSVYESRGLVEV